MLDEIAEMPVELQPKLLRVLQERTCRKIGSEKSYPVDFRLICSTNRMPADAIRDGLLRDDLFYRISTITIHVPPLRERMEDIQLLTDHFFKVVRREIRAAAAWRLAVGLPTSCSRIPGPATCASCRT